MHMFSQRYIHSILCLLLLFLYTNAIYAQEFTLDASSTAGLSGIDFGSGLWGDFDSDGDLDILLTGRNSQGKPSTSIYANENGVFSSLNTQLIGVSSSSAAWGDIDNDGDLDVAISGKDDRSQLLTVIYKNEVIDGEVTFVDLNQNLTGAQSGSVDWGDYDNDGDLDLLLTGNTVTNRPISQIFRNDINPETGEREFVDIQAGLEGIFLGNGTWGDYDNDGDLDILLTGDSFRLGEITRIYRNDSGSFSNINAALKGLILGRSTWGDYDNDGDIDILSVGNDNQGIRQAIVYNNDLGQFTNIGSDLTGVESGTAVWGDCDNDGDLDILISGLSSTNTPFASVIENVEGVFTEGEEIQGLLEGSAAWGDYDNDDDLDIMLAGLQADNNERRLILYRNNTEVRNIPPSSPEGLKVAFENSAFTLQWDPAMDTETPAEGLTYNIRVGTAEFDEVLVGPMALRQGYRKLPASGNAQHNTFYTLHTELANLAPAPFLVWSVQAVDPSYAGSNFAETSFIYLSAGGLDVLDVPEDEGGQVAISWNASHLDGADGTLSHYSVWRRIPDDSVNIGAVTFVTPEEIPLEFEGSALRRVTSDKQDSFWEWMGNEPVLATDRYTFYSPTTMDSSAMSDGSNLFMIVAHTNDAPVYFDSEAASGYSVDNLAPQVPENIQAIKRADGVSITWDPSPATDLKHYLVYRGETAAFETAETSLMATTTLPEFLDDSSFPAGTFYYKIIAEDINENRSSASDAISVVINTSTGDAISELPDDYTLHQNYPNPFNPVTLIQFDMPDHGSARLAIYNAYGQQVAVLIDQVMAAGTHTVSWQPAGLSSGTYYYRFETKNFADTKRMVFVK